MPSEARLPRVNGLVLREDKLIYGTKWVEYDEWVHLDPQQRIVMRVLLQNPDSILTVQKFEFEMYSGVRDSDLPDDPRLVLRIRISDLRKKLKALGLSTEVIETFWREGYRLNSGWIEEKPPRKIYE